MRYTTSSCTDLAGAGLWIGTKNTWAEQMYVVKTLSSTYQVTKVARIWAARVFSFPKNVHLKALLYILFLMRQMLFSLDRYLSRIRQEKIFCKGHGCFSKGRLLLYVPKSPCAKMPKCCNVPVLKRSWCQNITVICRNFSCQNVKLPNKPKPHP